MSYQLEGTVEKIGEVQTFKNDFKKVELILKTNEGEYSNLIKFEALNKVAMKVTDSLEEGQHISASFSIRGNEFNGKYYNNLVMYKWDALNEGALDSVEVLNEIPN